MIQKNKQKRISKKSVREAVHSHLLKCGFIKDGKKYRVEEELSKTKVRQLNAPHRKDLLLKRRLFVKEQGVELAKNFATGKQVDPEAIDPEIIEVKSDTPDGDLFRMATLLWSVPVSPGFGRRMRFLVKDKNNGKLMGLFALGDPVFNLSARDNWIGWTGEDRKKRLVHLMDAYVVGSVPPYSQLIGGKLIAALMASKEVIQAYDRKYLNQTSVISREEKRANLVLLTTTSALGRSSLYNRLAIPGGPKFTHIGATKGFGHFHLSGDVFSLMRAYLEQIDHPYASGHEFGMGPNWRFRVVRAALEDIGFGGGALKHGVGREVYTIPIATNWKEILLGTETEAKINVMSAKDIARFCLDRWLIPRSFRDKRFKRFARSSIMHCLLNGGPPESW